MATRCMHMVLLVAVLGLAAMSSAEKFAVKKTQQIHEFEAHYRRAVKSFPTAELSNGRKLRQASKARRLVKAISAGDDDAFFGLLGQANLDAHVKIGDDNSIFPLANAALENRADYVTALIDAGADPNNLSPYGVSALAVAAPLGNVAAVKALLRGGADPGRGLAMISAISQNQPAVVRLLMNAGADPNEFVSGDWRLIQYASWLGNKRVVNALAKGGADTKVTLKLDGKKGLSLKQIECGCALDDEVSEVCNKRC